MKTQELADGWVAETAEHLTPAGLAASSAKLLPAKTILMAMYGATVGKLGILTRPMTCNQASCALLVDESLASFRFLFYRLLQDRDQITNLATGAAQQNLNAGTIKGATLLFPPLDEQKRIAGVLGGFDDLIETNRAIINDIAAMTSAVYTKAAACASSSVALGQLVEANPEKVTPGAPTEDLRYLDIGSMSDGSVGTPTQMIWENAPSRARRRARRGDLLWATVRPNRRAHGLLMRDVPGLAVSTGIAVLRPLSIPASLAFAHTDTQSFVDRLSGRVDGSAYPAVKAEDFLALDVPDLLEKDVELFRLVIDPLWEAVGELEEEIDDVARHRDELLPLLMSGRVRVSEVEGVA